MTAPINNVSVRRSGVFSQRMAAALGGIWDWPKKRGAAADRRTIFLWHDPPPIVAVALGAISLGPPTSAWTPLKCPRLSPSAPLCSALNKCLSSDDRLAWPDWSATPCGLAALTFDPAVKSYPWVTWTLLSVGVQGLLGKCPRRARVLSKGAGAGAKTASSLTWPGFQHSPGLIV